MIFFYPKTIESQTSKINGEIKVTKLLGTYRLVVGGYTQSGGLLHNIWGKALRSVKKKYKFKNPRILILGFAGGTAAKLVRTHWPKSRITGIEIDPVVIKLSKKYFQVGDIPDLDLIKEDAIKWTIEKAKSNRKISFDIILVDLYIGNNPAPGSQDSEFLKAVRKLISKNGIALFNRLIVKKEKSEVREFKEKLEEVFGTVIRISTPANAVFSVRKTLNSQRTKT
jgi:spermidine synthase